MGYGPYSSDVTLLLSVARNMKEGMLISDKNVCFEKLGLLKSCSFSVGIHYFKGRWGGVVVIM